MSEVPESPRIGQVDGGGGEGSPPPGKKSEVQSLSAPRGPDSEIT